MNTNTNTELRSAVETYIEAGNLHILPFEKQVSELVTFIDQYVHQKTIEARIDELDKFGNTTEASGKALVYGSLYTVLVERQAHLQASLNTERKQ